MGFLKILHLAAISFTLTAWVTSFLDAFPGWFLISILSGICFFSYLKSLALSLSMAWTLGIIFILPSITVLCTKHSHLTTATWYKKAWLPFHMSKTTVNQKQTPHLPFRQWPPISYTLCFQSPSFPRFHNALVLPQLHTSPLAWKCLTVIQSL